jgi:predicted transcriptional regulator
MLTFWCGQLMFPLEQKPREIGNRTRIEILESILKVASNGALKTHIMYKANLSHRQLERYLAFLEERGLLGQGVDEDTGSRIYRITEKGFGFLRDFSHVSDYLALGPPQRL